MTNKYPLKSFMTVGQLKEIIKDMADDAIVIARDRDCISLCRIDVINHPKFNSSNDKECDLYFHNSIEDVYGGDERELENPSKQAIIFCDND